MLRSICAAALVVSGLWAGAAQAQPADAPYPSRTVKLIVPFPPGGGVDSVTRVIAEHLRTRLGQPFVVDNRGGASGNLGAEAVFTAEPDGYTLMASSPPPLAINVSLFKKLHYDPAAFTPVVLMATSPNVLAVRSELPVPSAQEFIAYAKAHPGKLNYASQGSGTTSHLTAEMFKAATGTELVHVPFKGTGPAVNDLLANQVDLMFVDLAAVIGLHEAGLVRILAVATGERVPELPTVPTLEEVGLEGFRSATWNGIAAPPKTPAPIVEKLNATVNAILRTPDVEAHLKKLHLMPAGGSPEDMARLMAAERKRWADVIKAANVRIQ